MVTTAFFFLLTRRMAVTLAEEAMQLLSDASMKGSSTGTEWSCVYNLNDYSVDICFDTNYDEVYSFKFE